MNQHPRWQISKAYISLESILNPFDPVFLRVKSFHFYGEQSNLPKYGGRIWVLGPVYNSCFKNHPTQQKILQVKKSYSCSSWALLIKLLPLSTPWSSLHKDDSHATIYVHLESSHLTCTPRFPMFFQSILLVTMDLCRVFKDYSTNIPETKRDLLCHFRPWNLKVSTSFSYKTFCNPQNVENMLAIVSGGSTRVNSSASLLLFWIMFLGVSFDGVLSIICATVHGRNPGIHKTL